MKPINMKTWEVQALLDNRKTVARRVMKPQPVWSSCGMRWIWKNVGWWRDGWNPIETITWKNTRYGPGDILYVQETFFEYKGRFYYKADDKHEQLAHLGLYFKWRPSIHMPREAARIFLRVTDVRVERLQDITDDGVEKEGVPIFGRTEKEVRCLQAFSRYPKVWNSTIKSKDRALYGWEADPWVWVVEFETIPKGEILQEGT